ncbi:MAG: flagellar hook assembly protein FlgD [Hyphomicrobium denitrificans]|jgi:flagellar basal-body rod modification protein FlgD|uniref:flagellar hook assembly protein FlgD n=1 Tax=Hyphomicrobium sp. GJ21 TaxID=113574 RepID=UPI000622C040|nr:flagellar hook assembly protein FlgD [Hyphomicrobium sp. GJ21]MBN9281736.1 flagellar hook assembly protein FlgD [Hyphomicrobium denitrificans]MBN9353687.1 flagellar hook assembly protein FlgD [Hyphomicrobium denitrificans]CEJ87400.1 Flagellar hook capping protein [Hyphomicrobium sp. GJ21]
MTTIPPTGNTSGTSNADANDKTKNSTLNYNDFLKLMVAQLRNQDPLNPTDSTEYMSQIAQFSSVEQGINTNAKLDQLLVNSNISQASTMIGLSLTSADGSVSGIVTSVRIDSTGSTAILNNGKEVPITQGVVLGYQ